jgi:hypothetical protein
VGRVEVDQTNRQTFAPDEVPRAVVAVTDDFLVTGERRTGDGVVVAPQEL